MKRLSGSRRKHGDMVMALCGIPWRPKPDEPALGEVPARVSAESKVPWQDLPDAPKPRAPEVESGRVCIRKDKELRKYAYSEGCLGCTAAAKARDHSDACRQRIAEKMDAEDEGRERLTSSFF